MKRVLWGIRGAKSTEGDWGKTNRMSLTEARGNNLLLRVVCLVLLVCLGEGLSVSCQCTYNIPRTLRFSQRKELLSLHPVTVVLRRCCGLDLKWPQRCMYYRHGFQSLSEMGSAWRKLSYWGHGLRAGIGDLAPSCLFSPWPP